MPSKLFAKIGLKQTTAFKAHMFMYGTPMLTFLQVENVTIFDEIIQNPLLAFSNRVFKDYDFLFGLIMLILLDSLTGGIAAWNTYLKDKAGNFIKTPDGKLQRAFSMTVLIEKMSKKLFGLTIAVLCIGILKSTKIAGEENLMASIVDAGFYSIMLGFEGASVIKNVYKIYPHELLKLILKKLEIFYNKKTNKVEDVD